MSHESKTGNGDPLRARATLFETIEDQLRRRDPPEALQTLERLLHLGYSHADCLKLIASAFVAEMNRAMRSQQAFDGARYAGNLARLPER